MTAIPDVPPSSPHRVGDVCYIRNHPKVRPVFRGVECTVISGLQQKGSQRIWMHQVTCALQPPCSRMFCSPEYLIPKRAPKQELGSWDECPFKPRDLRHRKYVRQKLAEIQRIVERSLRG